MVLLPPLNMNMNMMKLVKEEEEEEDRVSSLPDCLVLEILYRLRSTKEAITTSILSKRWKHVWTSVPTLDFTNHKGTKDSMSGFFPLVDKTITKCNSELKLNKFQLDSLYDGKFNSQLNNWIRYAINRDVEHLNLMLRTLSHEAEIVLDEFVYTSSCFTHLNLGYCIFNPIGAISWKNLKSLYISQAKLDEHLIANILSGSPLLETLNLNRCIGFRRVNITSNSVKNFGLSGFGDYGNGVGIVEIDAPNILSLTIESSLFLNMLYLHDVSSLVKAKLDYIRHNFRNSLQEEEKVDDQEMFKRLILNLCHIKELTIGRYRSRDFLYLKWIQKISPLKVFDCKQIGEAFRLCNGSFGNED